MWDLKGSLWCCVVCECGMMMMNCLGSLCLYCVIDVCFRRRRRRETSGRAGRLACLDCCLVLWVFFKCLRL